MPVDILVVDDEMDICDLVGGILTDEGYEARYVLDGVSALSAIRDRQPGLVILDVWLGDGSRDGLKILETIKRDHPYVPVVMMSGHSTVDTAVSAIKMGAYDFIEKPFQADRLLLIVQRAIDAARLKRENDELRVRAPFLCSLAGISHNIQDIKQQLNSAAQTNTRICIHGPAGCDREAIARYVQNMSHRQEQPFLSINCASTPVSQIDAELFGLDIINVDDQVPRKIGLVERAHNGTLFIDEISALPMGAQAHLMQFLYNGEFTRIGGTAVISANVRVITGSSQSVDELLNNKDFSTDLFYRTHVVSVSIPPLSSRTCDIALLAKQFLAAIAMAQNIPVKNLTPDALAVLESYSWPMDVQQLKNVLEASLIIATSNGSTCISIEDLPPEVLHGGQFVQSWDKKSATIACLPIKEARDAFEREYLIAQLKRFGGHISQVSKFIGMDRAALHRKLKHLGISSADSFENEDME
ncbi:MAG: sigma-54 dependent transcriptional regulator [Holosporales bacterium]|jgi:two-component system nitrogen regulation response regulator NtrX|nr:sigma-54 dependent transcriptional regulator [Holosporales bacterium]